MSEVFASLRQLNIWSMMLRIICAMAMGGIVGIEREKKSRPAGFRTYMLVALGAALTVMLGQYLDIMIHTRWAEISETVGIKTDVSRFPAQVINGVGFLGAGTIIVTRRQEVRGLTTAAGLWASACMGIAIGAGFYECMLVCVILIMLCMRLLPILEDYVVSRSRNMNVFIEMDSLENMGAIVGKIKSNEIQLYNIEIEKNIPSHITKFSILFSLGLPKGMLHAETLALLSSIDGIEALEEA